MEPCSSLIEAMRIFSYIRGYIQRPLVRPWALAGPVLVLMVCLPLLRPLLEPNPNRWSDEEQMIASSVQAIVENHTLAIDGTVFGKNPVAVRYGDGVYSPFPPMLSALLSPVYWVARRQGLNYGDDPIFVQYVLTLVGASVPVAMCAGLIYRLARIFELRRSLRVVLGFASVAGSGLITYGVVLNPHAPAAMLLLVAASCISHLAVAGHPYRHILTAFLAGAAAALAATVDSSAIFPAVLLCVVLLAMRWNAAMRIGALALYIVGAAPVIALSVFLSGAAHGSPGTLAYGRDVLLAVHTPTQIQVSADAPDRPAEDSEGDVSEVQQVWSAVSDRIGLILDALFGEHGVLSHFPVLVLGLLGAILVLHRNWTAPTKCLAAITLIAAALLVITYPFVGGAVPPSYATPWFLCISPLLLFWAGAWLKRPHRAQSWIMAAVVLVFSLAVASAGLLDPTPRGGYRGYSFAQATLRIFGGDRVDQHPPLRGTIRP